MVLLPAFGIVETGVKLPYELGHYYPLFPGKETEAQRNNLP